MAIRFPWMKKKIPSLSGIVERQPALWQERIPGQRSMYTAIERLVQPLILDVSPCKEVTIFRIGKDSDGDFRFFIAGGEALDKPKQFNGTSLVVKTNADAKTIVYESVEAGWEPHFVVAYGNVAAELEILAGMLNMEVQRY